MKIANFRKISTIDYPGLISSVVFTPECNYSCPSCHAKHIINAEEGVSLLEVFDFLDFAKDFVEGVVVCGGEPSLRLGLKFFLEQVRKMGFKTKIDTNGSNYAVLEDLLKKNLLDYIATDVKGSLELHAQLVGRKVDERDEIKKGISITTRAPDYEFRTTIVPVIRNGKKKKIEISYMTPDEIVDTAKMIVEYTQDDSHKYFLQPFVARKKQEGAMCDDRFTKEGLEELGLPAETPGELMGECYKAVKEILPNVEMRR